MCRHTYRGFLAAMAVLAVGIPMTASAQSRNQVYLRSELMVGEGPSTTTGRNYQDYSFGLGNLPRTQPAAGGGPLGSSIYQGHSLAIPRQLGPAAPAGLPAAGPSQRLYTPSLPSLARAAPSAGGVGAPVVSQEVQELFQSLAKERKAALDNPDTPVTTLVPAYPGEYRDKMIEGESAFRAGRYEEARQAYQEALKAHYEGLGALLSLTHTYFALGDYAQAGTFLARATKRFPELMQVKVIPADFFGDAQAYQQALTKLESAQKDQPSNVPASLLLGYLWLRQGQQAKAVDLLSLTAKGEAEADLRRAAQTLLNGVDARYEDLLAKAPPMGKSIVLANAGIELSLPEGLMPGPLRRSNQVLLASSPQTAAKPQSVSLLVFPIPQEMTADAFLAWAVAEARRNPAFSDLNELKSAEVTFRGVPGAVAVWHYRYRGNEAIAAGLCFARDAGEDNPARLAYALLVEVAADQIDALLPTLMGIVDSLKPVPVRRPVDLPVDQTGPVMRDAMKGYSVGIPNGWAAFRSETGLVMGQLDFARGGISSPAVQVFAITTPTAMTSQALAEAAIKREVEKGYRMEVLSQGPAELGGKAGYQVTVRKTPTDATAAQPAAKLGGATLTATTSPAVSWIEIGRFLCLQAPDGQTRLYAIVLDCYDCQTAQADALMNSVAASFSLVAAGS